MPMLTVLFPCSFCNTVMHIQSARTRVARVAPAPYQAINTAWSRLCSNLSIRLCEPVWPATTAVCCSRRPLASARAHGPFACKLRRHRSAGQHSLRMDECSGQHRNTAAQRARYVFQSNLHHSRTKTVAVVVAASYPEKSQIININISISCQPAQSPVTGSALIQTASGAHNLSTLNAPTGPQTALHHH